MANLSRFTPPRKVQRPQPPKVFASGKRIAYRSGPGLPPPGFIIATTSLSEWYIYWALRKILGPEGKGGWGFQIDAGGGRGKSGGAVIDFVVWTREPRLAIRIQTERYHVATTNRNQMYDDRSKRMLERLGYKVIDIWEQNYIKDKSGQAAIKKVKMALNGQEDPSPITAPTSLARPGRV